MAENRTIARLIEELLHELGEDAGREGLDKTPERVEKALRYFTSGYSRDVKEVLNEALQPRGVAVVVEAVHLCMLMRGVEKQNSRAITSAMLGAFRDRPETRAEFMALIKSSRGLEL